MCKVVVRFYNSRKGGKNHDIEIQKFMYREFTSTLIKIMSHKRSRLGSFPGF